MNEYANFKPGDLIVYKSEGEIYNTDIPLNYCFKFIRYQLFRDNTWLVGEWLNGNTSSGPPSRDFRLATKEEADEFNRLGEPYDVTTLKDKTKFQIGKWYKWYWKLNRMPTYGKCNAISSSFFNVSEGVQSSNEYYKNKNGYFYKDCTDIKELTDLSEIQKYLPEDHPDKEKDIPEYVELLSGFDDKHTGQIFNTKDNLPKYKHWDSYDNWNELLKLHSNFFIPSTKEAYDAQFKPKMEIGKYYTVTDTTFSKDFKLIGKVSVVEQGSDSKNIRGYASIINIKDKQYVPKCNWCYETVNGDRKFRLSTQEEIDWLDACIKADKFIPKEELKTNEKTNIDEVVYCQTKEEWDFAAKVLDRKSIVQYKHSHWNNTCIYLNNVISSCSLEDAKKYNFYIYSFEAWCSKFGHKPDFINEKWIPKVGEYIVYNNSDVLKIKEVAKDNYHEYWVRHTPNSFSGGDFGWKNYKSNIRKAEQHEIPNESNESELNKWLKETKALNLSYQELAKFIGNAKSCPFNSIFLKLKGKHNVDKAKKLYELWNPDKVINPVETVISSDSYTIGNAHLSSKYESTSGVILNERPSIADVKLISKQTNKKIIDTKINLQTIKPIKLL